MKLGRYNLIYLFIILMLGSVLSCKSGSGTSTEATKLITATEVISFPKSEGSADYRSIEFTNPSTDPITIDNIVFGNNVCGAFALYDVTDETGLEIFKASGTFPLKIAGSQKIKINVGYCPPECAYSSYTTQLYITYTVGTTQLQSSVALEPQAGGAICKDILICADDPMAHTYEPEIVESGLPPVGDYYFKVIRMRAFLYPVSAKENAKIIGTDIDVDPTAFNPAYLKVGLLDEAGKTNLYQINSCTQFIIPSASTDSYFAGADTEATTSQDYQSTVDADGNVVANDVTMTLFAKHIDDSKLSSASPLPDENGNFRLSLKISLSTSSTEPNAYLKNIKTMPNYTEEIMNISDPNKDGKMVLTGQPISRTDATLTLVGIGTFNNDDDLFLGQDTVRKIFFEGDPAYIFVQIDAMLMKRVN